MKKKLLLTLLICTMIIQNGSFIVYANEETTETVEISEGNNLKGIETEVTEPGELELKEEVETEKEETPVIDSEGIESDQKQSPVLDSEEIDSEKTINESNPEESVPVEEESGMAQTTESGQEEKDLRESQQKASNDGFVIQGDTLTRYTGKAAKVVIPSGVTKIAKYAFASCKTITDIEISTSVTSIGEGAFLSCTSLKNIKIPEGVKEVTDFMFNQCAELTSVKLPNSLERIGKSAFVGCNKLQQISLPPNLSEIADYAFHSCASLTSINIPGKVRRVGAEVFTNCKNLSNITIENGVQEIGVHAFALTAIKKIVLPDSITKVEDYAFSNCLELKEITFSKNLAEYAKNTLNYCIALEKITMRSNAPKIINNETGLNIGHNVTILVPENAKGYDVSPWSNYKIVYGQLLLPDAVKNLKAVPAGKNKAKLTWSVSSGAEGYLIYAQKDGKYGYCGMTTTGASFIDTKALDEAYNFYWVFPYVKDDNGKMRPGLCTKYVYTKGICSAVTNLKAASQKDGVKLTWTKSPEAEGYLIYGKTATGKYGYIGMTTIGVTFTDKKASKTEYNFYWVYPYHKNTAGKMIVGGTPKYVYGKAR